MKHNPAEDRSAKIIRLREVIALTGLARSTIYAKTSPKSTNYDPTFPKSRRLGERTIGWMNSEIRSWILSRPCSLGEKEDAK